MGASQKKTSWYQLPLIMFFISLAFFTLAFIIIITLRNTEYSAKDIRNMCSEVTNQLIVNIPENSKIAILNIQDISNDTAIKYEHSNLIVENLITNLVRTAANNYQVFERSQIDRAENEMNFQNSDLFDKTTVQSFGDFVGADYVIYGNLITTQDATVFNFRCISVSTSQIVGVANVQLLKSTYTWYILLGIVLIALIFTLIRMYYTKYNTANKQKEIEDSKVYSPDKKKYFVLLSSASIEIGNTDSINNRVVYKLIPFGNYKKGKNFLNVQWSNNKTLLVVLGGEEASTLGGLFINDRDARQFFDFNETNIISIGYEDEW